MALFIYAFVVVFLRFKVILKHFVVTCTIEWCKCYTESGIVVIYGIDSYFI